MAECHGGKLFVDMLEREGVRHIFMLSGESLLPIIDACIDSPISIIHTRHEESAGYMADAYARVTGGLGVVGVTQGPGSSNILHRADDCEHGHQSPALFRGPSQSRHDAPFGRTRIRFHHRGPPLCEMGGHRLEWSSDSGVDR